MKERVKWIDFLSGIMIIWMILYHIFIFTGNKQSLACEELYKIFFFFMPWFFFKSGMLANDASLKQVVVSSTKKLLVPYVVFSFLGYLAYFLQQFLLKDISFDKMVVEPAAVLLYTGSVLGNLPLWFLLGLFFDKVLWQVLINNNITRYQIAAISLIICFGGYFLGIKQLFYIWFTFSGLFFYSLGNILKNIQFDQAFRISAFVLYIFAIMAFPNSVQMRSNSLEFGYYILWPLTSVSAIIAWNNFAKYTERKVHKTMILEKLWGGVRVVGNNSMYLYVTHAMVLGPVTVAISSLIMGVNLFWATLLVCIVLLPFCSVGAKKLLNMADLIFMRIFNN